MGEDNPRRNQRTHRGRTAGPPRFTWSSGC